MTATLTFLFTDLEGSTRLWQQHPQAMKTTLARHDELVRSAVEDANGQVVKTTGDGFHVVFTSAEDGLRACILTQQSLQDEKWGETGPLKVRMGLHSGEAQQRAGDYYGTVVNRAARLMSAANGGQVLLSAAVANLVADNLPDRVSLLDLGEHRLKDLRRPEHIYQLVHPDLPTDFPAIASLSQLPNNLPIQPSVFVGRQEELGGIKDLLVSEKVRLLTLVGPGGTGKTRLALQTGADLIEHFTDGTFFVDLSPIHDPNSVLTSIARAVGLSESSNGSMLGDLEDQLHDKKMLLLLDNFEQVTAAALQVAELLGSCPHLKILVTTREALHVRGEYLYPVPPLGLPELDGKPPSPTELIQYESVQLFLERAQAVKPGFELTDENAEAIAELSQRLDGLPLAIELAAARIRLFSPQALKDRLGSRLKLLRGGARDLPERQQTLRDTIDWSYELLDEDERTLFEAISVFSGCTFEAVEAVIAAAQLPGENDIETEEGLISLVDKSLIRLLSDEEGEPRLRMLETIREYALEKVNEHPDLHEAVSRAHASYFADFTQRQWQRMTGREREAALEDMSADVENLRIAWHFWVSSGDLEQLQKMVNGLWMLYDGRGWYQSTIELTTDLLHTLSSTPSSPEHAQQEIMLQTSLARALMAIKGYTSEVEEAYNRALMLCDEYGEIPQLFPVLRGLSSFYMYRAEFDKGAEIGERILALAESRDDDYLRVHGYLVLGANTGFKESYEKGLEILGRGIDLFESQLQSFQPFQLGNNPGIVCYTTSAFLLYWLGFPDQAVERANRAIELAIQLNHPFTTAYALFHTGSLHMWRGDTSLANQRAQSMLDLAQEHGFQIWISLARMLLGATQVVLDSPKEGLENLEQGFQLYTGLKSPPLFYPQLISMRAIALAQVGQPAGGLQLLNSLLDDVPEERAYRELTPLMLLKGDLLLEVSPDNQPEAEKIFSTILANQDSLGGKILDLQTATRLCKLETQAGKAGQGGQLLAEIYNSYTEGFETADLQEARRVLDQLQG